MAQNNIFMGTGVRSVGDITLFRRGGKQIARVRVRDVANPRSEAQSMTRNFLAPVVKFYGPLRNVLARSFEGLDKSRSYNEFQRVNIRMAREKQWYLPKGTGFYPLPYQISRGSLMPLDYYLDVDEAGNEANWRIPGVTVTTQTIGQLSTLLIDMGLKAGDCVSFVCIVQTTAGDFVPYSFQFYVNTSSATRIDSVVSSAFSYIGGPNFFMLSAKAGNLVGFAVINARPTSSGWLRSTQYLAVDSAITNALVSAAQKAESLESYERKDNASEGDSYLDGDGRAFNCQTLSGRALLFYGGQYAAQAVRSGDDYFIQVKPANLDEFFYVAGPNGSFMNTDDDRSLNPADWGWQITTITAATVANTVSAVTDANFNAWLTSIGFSSS